MTGKRPLDGDHMEVIGDINEIEFKGRVNTKSN